MLYSPKSTLLSQGDWPRCHPLFCSRLVTRERPEKSCWCFKMNCTRVNTGSAHIHVCFHREGNGLKHKPHQRIQRRKNMPMNINPNLEACSVNKCNTAVLLVAQTSHIRGEQNPRLCRRHNGFERYGNTIRYRKIKFRMDSTVNSCHITIDRLRGCLFSRMAYAY